MWTNLEGFDHLTPTELDALLQAPVLITILVGAADGVLDREERTWSDRLMQARTYNKPKHLNDYYSVVAHRFLDKVDERMAQLPSGVEARNALISELLLPVNAVLAKIEAPLAIDLYKSYLGLAKETAKASGGFLRIGAISAQEARWVGLPMLTPVAGVEKYAPWEEDEASENADEATEA